MLYGAAKRCLVGDGMNVIIKDLRNDNNTFAVAAFSGIGKRESQQDAAYCYISNEEIYAVVCDGMGGLADGGRASQTAISVAAETNQQRLQKGTTTGQESPDWLAEVVLEADRAIFMLKDRSGKSVKAGSTLVSVWIKNNLLYWCSVGDSRLYLFRDSEVVQATTDMNYFYLLNEQRESGAITENQYQQEAVNGEALISFCGLGDVSIIDRNVEPLSLLPGDVILLCTDGFYRTIDEKWMQDILAACDFIEDAAEFVPQIIEQHGTSMQDNYTFVLIQIKK